MSNSEHAICSDCQVTVGLRVKKYGRVWHKEQRYAPSTCCCLCLKATTSWVTVPFSYEEVHQPGTYWEGTHELALHPPGGDDIDIKGSTSNRGGRAARSNRERKLS